MTDVAGNAASLKKFITRSGLLPHCPGQSVRTFSGSDPAGHRERFQIDDGLRRPSSLQRRRAIHQARPIPPEIVHGREDGSIEPPRRQPTIQQCLIPGEKQRLRQWPCPADQRVL